MTYGQIRLSLSKLAPGIDPELRDLWIQSRYSEILSRLPWQRLSVTAALATVADTALYALPEEGIADAVIHPDFGPLQKMSQAELDAYAPGRKQTGTPNIWAPAMDDTSDPPKAQIEIYPVPDAVVDLSLVYTKDASISGSTSATLLPWVQPAAIIAGVTADIKSHLKDYNGAQLAEARFEKLVTNMVSNEAQRVGPHRLQMAERYTDHRARRG